MSNGPKKKKVGAKGCKAKGKPAPQLTQDQRIEIALKICELYADGESTIESCCEACGVVYRTFKEWVDRAEENEDYSEIAESYKRAKDKSDQVYMDRLSRKAKTALEKKLEGYEVELEEKEGTPIYDDEGNPTGIKTSKIKKSKKYYAPDTTAIIFALKNTDPERFKDRYDHDVRAEGLIDYFDSLRDKGRALAKKETKAKKK